MPDPISMPPSDYQALIDANHKNAQETQAMQLAALEDERQGTAVNSYTKSVQNRLKGMMFGPNAVASTVKEATEMFKNA